MTSPTMWPPPAPQAHPAGPYPYPAYPGSPMPPNHLPPGYGGSPGPARKPRRRGRKLMAVAFAVSAVIAGGIHYGITHHQPAPETAPETPVTAEALPYSMDGKPTGYTSTLLRPLPPSEVGTGEGTFPVDNLTTTVKAGTQFTTKGGGVYGSSPVCVMGPITQVIPTPDSPDEAFTGQYDLRWTTTSGNCAAIPGADVFINVRGELVKAGEVDGGLTSDDTTDINLSRGIPVDPDLSLTGIPGWTPYQTNTPDAVAFDSVYPGGRVAVITGPRPKDRMYGIVTRVRPGTGGAYRVFITITSGTLTQKDRGATVMAIGPEVTQPLVMGNVVDTRDDFYVEVVPFDNKLMPVEPVEIIHDR